MAFGGSTFCDRDCEAFNFRCDFLKIKFKAHFYQKININTFYDIEARFSLSCWCFFKILAIFDNQDRALFQD